MKEKFTGQGPIKVGEVSLLYTVCAFCPLLRISHFIHHDYDKRQACEDDTYTKCSKGINTALSNEDMFIGTEVKKVNPRR